DFGDGATSTEQHPTHTYAEPGDYTVTLTVTDADDNSTTTSLLQRVVPPLVDPVLTYPGTVNEGSSARFTDATPELLEDRAIVQRTWHYDGRTTSNTLSPNLSFPDDGEYEVTLTLTDSLGMTASTTETVAVQNVAPTVSAGASLRAFVR